MNEQKLAEEVRKKDANNPETVQTALYLSKNKEATIEDVGEYLREKTGQGNPTRVRWIMETLEEVGFVEQDGDIYRVTNNY
jgi:hypothetical protein